MGHARARVLPGQKSEVGRGVAAGYRFRLRTRLPSSLKLRRGKYSLSVVGTNKLAPNIDARRRPGPSFAEATACQESCAHAAGAVDGSRQADNETTDNGPRGLTLEDLAAFAVDFHRGGRRFVCFQEGDLPDGVTVFVFQLAVFNGGVRKFLQNEMFSLVLGNLTGLESLVFA